MDKIILKNLGFYGYHGAIKEENKLGQKFFVDLELGVALKAAGKSDEVADTVHYGMVYDTVKAIVEGPPMNLIEAVAEKITVRLFDEFDKIMTIKIKLMKPEAPVAGIYDYFAVELNREREI